MSDDFGTVNVNRGQRAREIEVMRAHYRRHREALVSMAADAPTETLATAYQRLIHDIDLSLTKLDDLEGRGTGTIPLATPPPAPPTAPGDQPIAHTMYGDDEPTHTDYVPPYDATRGGGKSRLAIMVVATLLVLGAIAWLVWRGSSDRQPESAVIDTVDTSATAPIPDPDTTTTTTAAIASELAMTPAVQNYGTIRKGTRATRQFEINNRTDAPITVSVSRSACRCLFYEYVELVPPKGKESVTVTIDGARAKAGELRETVKVTSKKNPAVSTTFNVEAEIR
ncbi:MAG: hypothetical protein QOH21_881 [Acidobacteriota bacterium]|jgi:hypothetical protein|nr:hypothetical protein [Acidobacteriota bacterium]